MRVFFLDDPTLTSAIPGKHLQYTSLSSGQPIYENASVQPGSPSSQPIYTYCKAEPSYWPGVDYNGANVSLLTKSHGSNPKEIFR